MTWRTQTTVTGLPDEVLATLTEPDAIARWTPVPFELIDLDTDRLVAGGRARVRGRLAGRTLEFDVEVLAADDERVKLVATGPVSIDVGYALRPAAGALDGAISRIGRQLKARTTDLSPQTTVPHHRTSGSHSTFRARLPTTTVTRLAPAPATLLRAALNGAVR